MADEEEKKTADESADSVKAQKPKSDVMMYVIVGVGALVVTVGVMLGLISGEKPASADAEAMSEESAEHAAEHDAGPDAAEAEQETPDIFSELDDLSFLTDTLFDDPMVSSSDDDAHGSKTGKQANHSKSSAKAAKAQSANDSLVALSWLETEKKKLKKRNKALDEKAKRLEALERSVNQKLTKVDQAEAARLSSLAKLYNGMKPDQVARMMVKLEDKMIVAILPRMKSAQAAKILGLLPATRGARISKEMVTLSSK